MNTLGNVGFKNHIIHFILGMLAFKYNFLIPLFLIYQLIDGIPLKYKVTRIGPKTDDIPLDLLFFCLGEIFMRLINKYIL